MLEGTPLARSYTFATGSLPGALNHSLAGAIGAGCEPDYALDVWACLHRPCCSPTPDAAVAAELRRRGWPARRVRAWLAMSRGAWLHKEDTPLRRSYGRRYRHRANQAVRNSEFDEATDAAESWRPTAGWLTW